MAEAFSTITTIMAVITGVLIPFLLYYMKQMSERASALDRDIREILKSRTEDAHKRADDAKYLHENFVLKETYLYGIGQFSDRLSDIFKKLDETSKQLNQIIGSQNHKED